MLELKPKAGFGTGVENMGGGERGGSSSKFDGVGGRAGSFRPFHEYFACG